MNKVKEFLKNKRGFRHTLKGVVMPVGSKCEICSIEKPLDFAHIVPRRFFIKIRNLNEKGKKILLENNGGNTIILCRNHHTLYDRFDLDDVDFMKIIEKWLDAVFNLVVVIGQIYQKKKDGTLIYSKESETEMMNWLKKMAQKYGKK